MRLTSGPSAIREVAAAQPASVVQHSKLGTSESLGPKKWSQLKSASAQRLGLLRRSDKRRPVGAVLRDLKPDPDWRWSFRHGVPIYDGVQIANVLTSKIADKPGISDLCCSQQDERFRERSSHEHADAGRPRGARGYDAANAVAC